LFQISFEEERVSSTNNKCEIPGALVENYLGLSSAEEWINHMPQTGTKTGIVDHLGVDHELE
jgi:hypothetical protein